MAVSASQSSTGMTGTSSREWQGRVKGEGKGHGQAQPEERARRADSQSLGCPRAALATPLPWGRRHWGSGRVTGW